MAEARRDEEEEPRDLGEHVVLRNRRGQSSPATDLSERNKPERRLSSHGALSSIRAAIKRTSTRTSSPGDRPRDRRRPEITILSAEPLASNAWFPGASGGFPAPPPPAQPIWGGNIPAAPQPPPSYDQVIKEKTQEQVPPPPAVAPTRQSTTIATQTDFLLDPGTADPECIAAPRPTEKEVSAGGRPTKPPRPSLPCVPKPEPGDAAIVVDRSCPIPAEAPPVRPDTSPQTNHQAAEAQLRLPDPSSANRSAPSPPLPVPCDEPTEPFDTSRRCHVSVDRAPRATEAETAPAQTQRPTPRPRTRPGRQSTGREVRVQTLVRIKDDGDAPQPLPCLGGLPSGKYLQELLDIFCADDQCHQGDPSEQADPSDELDPGDASDRSEEDDMSVSHSQRNIKAKIQAYEHGSAETGENGSLVRPEPRPRTQYLTPPAVAAKPAFASRPSSLWEPVPGMVSVLENHRKEAPSLPTPKPRPLLPRVSFEAESRDVPVSPVEKVPLLPPSRSSVMARAKSLTAQEEESPVSRPAPPPKVKSVTDLFGLTNSTPPLPPAKPITDLFSLTNNPPPTPPAKPIAEPFGFASNPFPTPPAKLVADMFSLTNSTPPPPPAKPIAEPFSPAYNPPPLPPANNPPPLPSAKPGVENGNADRPFGHVPVKPQRSTTVPPSVARKPTVIRVPSRAEKVCENEPLDAPPPLPVQKPIGGAPFPVFRKPSLVIRPTYPPPPPLEPINPEGFGSSMPEISLPPRPVGGKVLPPPPTPTKGVPGRPPPPRAEGPRTPSSQPGQGVVLPRRSQTHKGAVKKGPVLPPRPNPGHPLYNTYTLRIPHAIAEYDYNGSNTTELSFQKKEVLVLLEQIDSSTFECQVGDTRGRVNKSYLKVITPLSSAPARSSPQPSRPASVRRGSSGLQVQALHDFTPESAGELALRSGDLVSMVEWVDSEWYRGTCRGATGTFPVSFVRVLSTVPAPPNGPKAPPVPETVSEPICVARFDFEGEHSDELSFSEGDVIRLKEYIGEDWARGQLHGYVGIFPLNFVETLEDLKQPPPAPIVQPAAQKKIALPGMVSTPLNHVAAKPSQPKPAGAEWGLAQFGFTAQTDEDLSFQQGAIIQITERVDSEWSRGRLDGREGYFPAAFVEACAAPPSGTESPRSSGGEGRARVLFDFLSESEDELSLKVGDIVTSLESVDDEWFVGDLRGMRGLLPKNYVQVLAEP